MNETRGPRVFDDVRMIELNPGMKSFALLLIFCGALARGTTVEPVDHTCPICGTVSITMQLGSYSQFGEPAHDLSDSPQFSFYGVNVCPNDLFASWESNWDEVGPEDKAKLSEFLKHPAVVLTAQEKAIVGDHLEELRSSGWWEELWARSCDEIRKPDPRHRWRTAIAMNYTGLAVTSEWEKKLATHYREQAILELKAATTSSWATDVEKRISSYLQAELTRQAGRGDEAKALFSKVISYEKTLPPDEDFAWIARWAQAQLELIDKPAPTPDPVPEVEFQLPPPLEGIAPPIVGNDAPPSPKPMGEEETLNEIRTTDFLTRDEIWNSRDPEIIKALEARVERLRQNRTQVSEATHWARLYEIRSFEAFTRRSKLSKLPVR